MEAIAIIQAKGGGGFEITGGDRHDSDECWMPSIFTCLADGVSKGVKRKRGIKDYSIVQGLSNNQINDGVILKDRKHQRRS